MKRFCFREPADVFSLIFSQRFYNMKTTYSFDTRQGHTWWLVFQILAEL